MELFPIPAGARPELRLLSRPESWWENERVALNHDLLHGQLVPFLSRLHHQALGRIGRSFAWHEEIGEAIELFCRVLQKISNLYARFELEMSPRSWVADPPFDVMDSVDRNHLAELIHALWLERGDVKEILQAAEETIKTSLEQIEKSKEAILAIRDPHAFSETTAAPLFRLITLAQELSIQLSRFPRGILPP